MGDQGRRLRRRAASGRAASQSAFAASRIINAVSPSSKLLVPWGSVPRLTALTAVHKAQDIAYWEYVEDALGVEQGARDEWRLFVERLEEQIAQSAAVAELVASQAGSLAPVDGPASRLDTLADTSEDAMPPCAEEAPCPVASCAADPDTAPLRDARSPGERPSAGEVQRYFDQATNDGVDFKVYVYDLPAKFNSALKDKQPRCVNDQYGTEIRFHENLLASAIRTTNPDEAEFFFVPIYGECNLYLQTELLGGKGGFEANNRWYLEALRVVTHDKPHWNRTQGRDHVWVFPGARGPLIFPDWKRHIRKSIFLTPEGDRSLGDQFNTWKDIVIPGLEAHPDFWSGRLCQREAARDTLAFFRGTVRNKNGAAYSRGIRIELEQLLRNEEGVVFGEFEPGCDRDCYRLGMRKSTFCLCPRGWSPWTLRAYQAMMVGCIPVVIADEIEFPFENSLDWAALTIKISELNATDVLSVLRSLPQPAIDAKRAAIDRVWRKVAWPAPSAKGDAFHEVLLELQRKRRFFKASHNTWWLQSNVI